MRSSDEIRKQAKALMDEFSDALKRAEDAPVQIGVRRKEATRPGKAASPDPDFRERMLQNAPRKKDGYIVAERK